MSISQYPVILDRLFFSWPDGDTVLDDLDATFQAGRTGLVGANGTGKTTLLRLIAGELAPTLGTVLTSGEVGYLPQNLILRRDATVADLCGIRAQADAMAAIESGDYGTQHVDALDGSWDVIARCRALLDRVGLPDLELTRSVKQLSGGESVLAALAGLRFRDYPIALLDEPTNNLDRDARARLHELVRDWQGTLIVVSHDLALLELMDSTAELRRGSLTVFGGPFSAYREHVRREQEAVQQALRTAKQNLRSEQRQRIDADITLARRRRYARTDYENRRRPKIVMNQRKTEAQVSAGKLREQLDDRIRNAQRKVDERAEQVRRDPAIRVDLPDPDVPASRQLAQLWDASGRRIIVQGPERVALTGRNGIGKTRLLEKLVGHRTSPRGRVDAERLTERIGYLPQRLDHLDDGSTILAAVQQAAPHVASGDIRAQLARFLFRTDSVCRRVGDLSGGERFRVALARLLLADPPHQLLVFDEPTNNLDLTSQQELVTALEAYRGGLIVVSHDDALLSQLRIDAWIEMTEAGLSVRR